MRSIPSGKEMEQCTDRIFQSQMIQTQLNQSSEKKEILIHICNQKLGRRSSGIARYNVLPTGMLDSSQALKVALLLNSIQKKENLHFNNVSKSSG